MRRAWQLQIPLLIVVLLGAGVVWLTYHPDSPVWDRLVRWPGIGPAAARLRQLYQPAPATEPPEAASAADERDQRTPAERRRPAGTRPPDPQERGALPFDWFVAGATIHRQASESSAVLERLSEPTRLVLLERRGDWARVQAASGEGWILVDETTVAQEPPLGRAPAPVTAIAGRTPDAERLERGLELLGDGRIEDRSSPYSIYTDSTDPALIQRLAAVARHHDESYRRRFGTNLIGNPHGAILLFHEEETYRRFKDRESHLSALPAGGHAGHGLAALFVGRRSEEAIVHTLVHELTHLVNRRGVGPALPPWLDEGLADDLANHRFDEEGSPVAGSWAGAVIRQASTRTWTEALASLHRLEQERQARRLLPLEELLALPWEDFVDPRRSQLHYAQSAFFLRFLLAQEWGHREGFRAFLDSAARGGPVSGDALLHHLGASWRVLDQEFASWLALTAAGKV